MSEEAVKEILDRVRRTETRVTKMGHAMGVDVGGGRPIWNAAQKRVMLPSPNCSIGECLAIIPAESKSEDVDLYIGAQYLCTIFIDH